MRIWKYFLRIPNQDPWNPNVNYSPGPGMADKIADPAESRLRIQSGHFLKIYLIYCQMESR